MERVPLLGIGDAKRLLGYSEGAPLSWSVDSLGIGGGRTPSFLRAFASRICRRIRSRNCTLLDLTLLGLVSLGARNRCE